MTPFSIRKARPGDARAMVELLNPIIESNQYTIMDEPLSLAEQLEYLRRFPGRGVFNVAVDAAGALLGMQSVEPYAAMTHALRHVGDISTFVSLSSLRQGVGRALWLATAENAMENGFKKLMATIRTDNQPAIAYYCQQGFEEVGVARRHAWIGGRFVDEVVTERWIEGG